eukprot:97064-Pyramimonas_sp.AAC.2
MLAAGLPALASHPEADGGPLAVDDGTWNNPSVTLEPKGQRISCQKKGPRASRVPNLQAGMCDRDAAPNVKRD